MFVEFRGCGIKHEITVNSS